LSLRFLSLSSPSPPESDDHPRRFRLSPLHTPKLSRRPSAGNPKALTLLTLPVLLGFFRELAPCVCRMAGTLDRPVLPDLSSRNDFLPPLFLSSRLSFFSKRSTLSNLANVVEVDPQRGSRLDLSKLLSCDLALCGTSTPTAPHQKV